MLTDTEDSYNQVFVSRKNASVPKVFYMTLERGKGKKGGNMSFWIYRAASHAD